MDWFKVLTLAGSVIGSCCLMQRQNAEIRRKRAEELKAFNQRLSALEMRYTQLSKAQFEDWK